MNEAQPQADRGCDEKGVYKKEEKKKTMVLSRHTDRQERERERNQPLEKPGGCTPAVVRVQSERAQQQSPTKNERQ